MRVTVGLRLHMEGYFEHAKEKKKKKERMKDPCFAHSHLFTLTAEHRTALHLGTPFFSVHLLIL
jgi:hypothetical protein